MPWHKRSATEVSGLFPISSVNLGRRAALCAATKRLCYTKRSVGIADTVTWLTVELRTGKCLEGRGRA